MSAFGTIVTSSMVRHALEETIKRWIPDYLAEVADQAGRERASLPVFKSYHATIDDDHFVENQLPCCVIVAPGTDEVPTKYGDSYEATWVLGALAVVSGQSTENTFELAEMYAAALRTLVVHHQSLGGFAESTRWAGERYDDFTIPDDSRTKAAGTVQFLVTVPNVVDLVSTGPVAPTVDPSEVPDDWGTVGDVEVGVLVKEEV